MSTTSDQPWFGPRCRAASDAKYHAWLPYKRNSTRGNKPLHKQDTDDMLATQRWAIKQWERILKDKLENGQIGRKEC